MRDNSELTLRNQKDFTRVYNQGKSKGSKYVVVLYKKNNLGYTRTAFVASKKVGNSVQRNRSRRLMRAAFYNFRDRMKDGYDVIFVARNAINDAGENDVEKAMFGAARACGIINN